MLDFNQSYTVEDLVEYYIEDGTIDPQDRRYIEEVLANRGVNLMDPLTFENEDYVDNVVRLVLFFKTAGADFTGSEDYTPPTRTQTQPAKAQAQAEEWRNNGTQITHTLGYIR